MLTLKSKVKCKSVNQSLNFKLHPHNYKQTIEQTLKLFGKTKRVLFNFCEDRNGLLSNWIYSIYENFLNLVQGV